MKDTSSTRLLNKVNSQLVNLDYMVFTHTTTCPLRENRKSIDVEGYTGTSVIPLMVMMMMMLFSSQS